MEDRGKLEMRALGGTAAATKLSTIAAYDEQKEANAMTEPLPKRASSGGEYLVPSRVVTLVESS